MVPRLPPGLSPKKKCFTENRFNREDLKIAEMLSLLLSFASDLWLAHLSFDVSVDST